MTLFIGKSDDSEYYLDAEGPRSTFICGKRGTGKSYTLGVIAEEVQDNISDTVPLIVDPMGIYWTMSRENEDQKDIIWDWGMSTDSYPVNLLTPSDPRESYGDRVYEEMKSNSMKIKNFKLNPSDISSEQWVDIFDLNINKPMGIALQRSVRNLNEESESYSLDDMISEVRHDGLANDRTIQALVNRIQMAKNWDIFSEREVDIWNVLDKNRINVLDLSMVHSDKYGLRNMIVDIICQQLFNMRMKSRKKEEFGIDTDNPKVWLFIDEAHNFIPTGSKSLSKNTLIRWIKEGRQPGLSVSVATQQPSAIDSDFISQCDTVISHRITTKEDIKSLSRLNQEYMGDGLQNYVREMSNRGEAVILDDLSEEVIDVKIRPRMSRHGGDDG